VQVAVMGRFGDRIGPLEALAFATLLTAAITLVTLVVARRSLAGFEAAWSSPRWMWVGALMGAVIVLAITVAAPKVGVVATTGLLIAGQLLAATLIDRFGWFGVERAPVTLSRAVGLALLAAGALLILRR
ncbi:MAG: DMT family transporter, partial [Gaiella sp.]